MSYRYLVIADSILEVVPPSAWLRTRSPGVEEQVERLSICNKPRRFQILVRAKEKPVAYNNV